MADADDTFDDLVSRSREAYQEGKTDAAIDLLTEAIGAAPQRTAGWYLRGTLYEALRRHDKAAADFRRVLKLDPKHAQAHNRLGSELLARGKFKEAIDQFDAYLRLEPKAEASHWKRGIAYYYAGRYEDGKRQFEAYQTFDNADVENAVWRFLCMARDSGFENARKEILKIGDDRRVPMRQIYDLFAGEAEPDDVLAAARAGDPPPEVLNRRLFYAHQYLGLYYEALGKEEPARKHTLIAADKHKIAHYMWDVARAHAELFRAKDKDKDNEQ